MSMNLPAYVKEFRQANGEFQETISKATSVFQTTASEAAEKLDEKLRVLRTEFFEDEEDRAVEVAPKKYA